MADREAPPGNRYLWPLLAVPGIVWVAVLFVAPLYVVLAILFGGVDPILRQPVPVWNPYYWDFAQFKYVWEHIVGPDALLPARPGPHRRVRRHREPALPGHRLPGRVLHRTLRRPVEGRPARRR